MLWPDKEDSAEQSSNASRGKSDLLRVVIIVYKDSLTDPLSVSFSCRGQ